MTDPLHRDVGSLFSTTPLEFNIQAMVETLVPSFFVPAIPKGLSSPVLHFNQNKCLIVTCFNPSSVEGSTLPSSLATLEPGKLYCVKVCFHGGKIGLETDAEITRFLSKSLPSDQTIVPKFGLYLRNYDLLVRDYVEGMNLRMFLETTSIPPCSDQFVTYLFQRLEMAISLTHIISTVHELRVCHCDLKPENIIFDPNSSKLSLIDFGLSVILPLDRPFVYYPTPRGSPLYMSPEASCKINKPVGFHSDMYSLGFILYELIAQIHPFSDENFISHTAQTAETLFDNLIRRGIIDNDESLLSLVIKSMSDIISKMYQISIDRRYHSLMGVCQDLEYIYKCMLETDVYGLQLFQAGAYDVITSLTIPYTVYGREDALEKMSRVLNDLEISHKSNIIIIKGYSGIGKSSLFKEFRSQHKDLICLDAKYDQSHNVPFFSIHKIIKQVISITLGESDAYVSSFVGHLLSLVSPIQVELFCTIIPDFKLLSIPNGEANFYVIDSLEHDERIKLFSDAGKLAI